MIIQDEDRKVIANVEKPCPVPRIGERTAFADIVYEVVMVTTEFYQPKGYANHRHAGVRITVRPT